MRRKNGWLIALLVVALLVVACGPEMATPTPEQDAAVDGGETDTPTDVPTEAPADAPTAVEAPDEPAVSEDDWRVLGSPDAEVTIVEYSDFQ